MNLSFSVGRPRATGCARVLGWLAVVVGLVLGGTARAGEQGGTTIESGAPAVLPVPAAAPPAAAERPAVTAATGTGGQSSRPLSGLDYLYLFGAIACQVGMVLAYRAASKPENDRHTVLLGAYLVSSAVSAGIGFVEFGAAFPVEAFAPTLGHLPMYLGLCSGVLLVFSAELYLRSTAHGPISITWTIRQNETILATVVSFFKDPVHEFSLLRLCGVLLLPPTLVMFGWDKRVQERKRAAAAAAALREAEIASQNGDREAVQRATAAHPPPVPWIALTIVSMLILGTYRSGTLWIVKDTKTSFMLYQYMTCALVALGFIVFKRHRMGWGELRGGMTLGVVSSFNLYFTLTSMGTVGPVMTFAALAVGVPIAVMLLGRAIYGERLHWRSMVGMLLALTALLLTIKWQRHG